MEAVLIPLIIVIALLCRQLGHQEREVDRLRKTIKVQDARIGRLQKIHRMACSDICALENRLEKMG